MWRHMSGHGWSVSTAAAVTGAVILIASQTAHPAGQTFQSPTFYKEVLPILQKNCQSCHRPGQIAPFSLLTYESTRPWARSIRTKVESRQMPPWFADPHVSEFSNNPSLTDGQIETIVKWVDGGAPAGDAHDAPSPLQWAENGWTVKPDFVIKGMEYPVPAHTPSDVIEWATYYVPTGLTKDTWITSLEIKPSELSVTHHICVTFVEHNPAIKYNDLLWVDRKRDEAGVDLEDNGINNLVPPGAVRAVPVTNAGSNDGCYVPGKSFEDYRIYNSAKLIPAGSDLRFQIHYTPTGKERVDLPEVGVTIAKEPPQRIYITAGISAPGGRKVFAIPPNDPNWSSPPAQATFTADAELVWMMPHMVDDAAHACARQRHDLCAPVPRWAQGNHPQRAALRLQLAARLQPGEAHQSAEGHQDDGVRPLRQLSEQQVQPRSEPDRLHGDDDLGRDDVPVLQCGCG